MISMKRLFDLDGDPFLPYDRKAWRPRFRVVPHPPGQRPDKKR